MFNLLLLASCITAVLATSNPAPSACTNQKAAADNPNQIVKLVEVGKGGLTYTPDSVSFLDEDPTKEWFVMFKFNPQNHTVTESSFDEPCVPIAKSKAFAANSSILSEKHPGIKSGFVPVTSTDNFTRTFAVKVNDTKPLWLFCGQQPHCKKGMVMVINQAKTGNKTLEAYKAKAALFDAAAQSAAAPPAAGTSTSAAADITPAPTATGTNTAPAALTPSTTSASASSLVSVFSGAAPTNRPVHFAALGGIAIAGAVALL